MSKIIIIEDKIKRALSLATQLKNFSQKNDEIDLDIECICIYCEDKTEGKKLVEDIRKNMDFSFKIKVVDFFDFSQVLDEYFYNEEEPHLFLSDYILEDYGISPTNRINIRYAREKMKNDQRKIWVYTATGISNENIIKTLLGEDYFISVDEITSDDQLKIKFTENPEFMNQIRKSDDIKLSKNR